MTLVSQNPRVTGAGPKAHGAPLKPIKLVEVAADKKHVVKAGEVLWDISVKLLGPNGRNSAKVAKLVEAFKKENPLINCAQRDFGNLLAVGDELKIPNIDWAAAAPKTRPAGAATLAAEAKAQNELNAAARAELSARKRTTLLTNLQVAVNFVKDNDSLNAGQRNLVASLVAQAERLGEPLPISDDDLNQLKLASAETENTNPNPSDVYGVVG